MATAHFTSTLQVSVNGAALSADLTELMAGVWVDDNLHLPDLFCLRFRDPDRLVLQKSGITIGSKLQLAVLSAQNAAPEPLMTGEVTALEVELDSAGTFTIVRGYDAAHRLLRGTRSETYQQMTYADVVKKVAQRNGIQTGTVDQTSTVHPLLCQANQTDWDFLRTLADSVGYHLGVEEGKLTFTKPVKAATASGDALELGADLLRLRAAVTAAGQVPNVEVRGWDDGNQRAVVASVPAATTSAEIGVKPADLASTFAAPPWVVTHVPHRTQSTADAAAKALVERVAGSFAELDGVCRGNPKLRAGVPIAIGNLGAPFDGKYTLSRVRHVFEPDAGYLTQISVTGQQDRSLRGLTSSTAENSRPGVATGVVTDVKDPENLGRVKVRLPWMRDDFGTFWARVLQIGAGADRGAMLLPEVNDEVLVAFEQGDVGAPFVLGGLYSAKNKPYAGRAADIDGGSGAVNRRAFVGRTGHALEILESREHNGIWLHTGDGKLSLAMDGSNAPVITVHSDGKVVVEAKDGVDIDAGTGGVKVTGGQKIELTAKTGITLDAGGGDVQVKGVNVDVKGTAQASLSAAKVGVTGQAMTEINGGAACTITAALVKIN